MEKGTTAGAHPVLELIRQRARVGSRPQSRRDGARLGLAIEGGAMRGVVSAGMLKALEHLGLLETFDAVIERAQTLPVLDVSPNRVLR